MNKLPSWVPDYSSDKVAGMRQPTIDGILSRDPACKVTFFKNNEKIIQLEAAAFDMLQYLGPKAKVFNSVADLTNFKGPMNMSAAQFEQCTATNGSSPMDWYLRARQLARDSSTSARTSKSLATVDQEFWKLCMSQSEYLDAMGTVATLYPPLSPAARKLFESFLLTDTEALFRNPQTVTMVQYLLRRFSQNTSGKVFCITAAGSMALVPPLVKEGDTLVHVRGGYIPMVLRRESPGVRRAELVGTCIVQHVKDVYLGSDWENWLLE
jgi:hypothetical protein